LNNYHKEIEKFLLKELKLTLHKNKKTINLVRNGVDFAGYKIKPGRMFLREKTLRKAFNIIKKFNKRASIVTPALLNYLYCVLNSYLGQLRAVNGFNLRKKILKRAPSKYFEGDMECTKVKKTYLTEFEKEYLEEL